MEFLVDAHSYSGILGCDNMHNSDAEFPKEHATFMDHITQYTMS
jgi:hypothetical protein